MSGHRQFVTGEVLTAANVNSFLMNQSVMVFDNDAARASALSGVLSEGMLTYNKAEERLEVFDGVEFQPIGSAAPQKFVELFTATGTFTVPADVEYVVAYAVGGGGGIGTSNSAGNGGTTSVNLPDGTLSSRGGIRGPFNGSLLTARAGRAGTSQGASGGSVGDFFGSGGGWARNGRMIARSSEVTPGSTVSFTIGAGGSAGSSGAAGGSGFVMFEYYQPTDRGKRVELFTSSGTFTPPAGVTQATAHMCGGGGGIGRRATAGNGGNSSVAFNSGTVTGFGANGGAGDEQDGSTAGGAASTAGLANTARGALRANTTTDSRSGATQGPSDTEMVTASGTCTPLAGIAVTVGNGGSPGTAGAAGGSGFVFIEFYEEV